LAHNQRTLRAPLSALLQDGWTKVFQQAYSEYSWSWVLFIAFVVVTCFIFVNLLIAVICDAVRVMSDKGLAGLTGCDENQIKLERSRDPLQMSPRECSQSTCSLRQKLHELERQVDGIILMQSELLEVLNLVMKSQNDSDCD
jgi:hypothetical protein